MRKDETAACTIIRLMIRNLLHSALLAASVALAFACSVSLSVSAQSKQASGQSDIVDRLLPDGEVPKDLRIRPDQRRGVIRELKAAQATAHGQRAQQVAFLLAALHVEYARNRDYLLHILSGCNHPQPRYGCDYLTGQYLIFLCEHGHGEILTPLLKTGIDGYNAAGTEALGAYFGEMVQRFPEGFLQAVSTMRISDQKRACEFAGAGDGGGLGAEGLAQARRNFRRIGGAVARRCLVEIELANKAD